MQAKPSQAVAKKRDGYLILVEDEDCSSGYKAFTLEKRTPAGAQIKKETGLQKEPGGRPGVGAVALFDGLRANFGSSWPSLYSWSTRSVVRGTVRNERVTSEDIGTPPTSPGDTLGLQPWSIALFSDMSNLNAVLTSRRSHFPSAMYI